MTSPYELRFNIFNVAKEILDQQYKANLEVWKTLDKTSKEAADLMPKFPTVNEVVEKAIEINSFVSDANQRELVKIAKRASGIGIVF